MEHLYNDLINISLKWEKEYGIVPKILPEILKYDAVIYIDYDLDAYAKQIKTRKTNPSGYDILFKGKKYLVKGGRRIGENISTISPMDKPKNKNWDYLIWILYDQEFKVLEVWQWENKVFYKKFQNKTRITADKMRTGKYLYINDDMKQEFEFMVLKKLEKTEDGYEGIGEVTFNIINCNTTQDVIIKQKRIPKELEQYVGKKLPIHSKNEIRVKCDASACTYYMEDFQEGMEKFRVASRVSGIFKILSVVHRKKYYREY